MHATACAGGLERRASTRLSMEADVRPTSPEKAVHVRAYHRTRFGRLEHVCEHWRSWPGQLHFDFYER
jgi:hypothetical protein